jgi:hypothetical protein
MRRIGTRRVVGRQRLELWTRGLKVPYLSTFRNTSQHRRRRKVNNLRLIISLFHTGRHWRKLGENVPHLSRDCPAETRTNVQWGDLPRCETRRPAPATWPASPDPGRAPRRGRAVAFGAQEGGARVRLELPDETAAAMGLDGGAVRGRRTALRGLGARRQARAADRRRRLYVVRTLGWQVGLRCWPHGLRHASITAALARLNLPAARSSSGGRSLVGALPRLHSKTRALAVVCLYS